MYYIMAGGACGDGTYLYGVKDTKDCVIESYTLEQLREIISMGIRIENAHLLDVSKSVVAKLALLANKDFVFTYKPYCGVFCSYIGNEKSIVVPEGVNILTEVSESVVDIKLPSTLWEISNSCFEYNSRLRSVEFPSNPYMIDDNAFYSCRKLKSVDLRNCIYIGGYAFKGSGLESIESLISTKFIGTNAFADCYKLSNIPYISSSAVVARDSFQGVTIGVTL